MLEFLNRKLERAAAMSAEQMGPYHPLRDLSGGIMILRDGSLSLGFTCEAPISAVLPNEVRGQLYEGLRTVLKTLPEGVNLQFQFSQHSRTTEIREQLAIKNPIRPLIERAIEARTDSLIAGMKSGRYRETVLDVYLSAPAIIDAKEISRRIHALTEKSTEQTKQTSSLRGFSWISKLMDRVNAFFSEIVNPLNGAVMLTFDEYKQSRASLLNAAQSLKTSLTQAGLKPQALGADELLSRLFRKNNPAKFEHGLNARRYDPAAVIPVSEFFLSSPLDWDPAGKRVPKGMIYLDGIYHKILTLRMPPGQMSFPHLEVLGLFAGLQKMDIVVNLVSSDVTHRIKALEAEKTAIEANDKGQTKEYKLAEIMRELAELGSGEEKIWNAQHLFIVRDKDPEEVTQACMRLQTMAQRAEETEVTEEIHAVFNYWMASQPGWARDLDLNRHNIFNTRQLTAMMPCFGGEKLKPKTPKGAVFPTSDGSLFNIYPHDGSEFAIANILIVGRAGSGKSVLTNTLMTQICRQNPRVIMVDIGRSYKRLCESMGGTFVEYDIRTDECRVNIFDIFTGRSPDAEEVQGTILLLGKMIAEKSTDELSGSERAAIEDALITLANGKKGHPFYMRDFRDTLQGFSGNRVAQDIAIRLSRYVGSGSYAKLFDGPTKVPSGSRMTVFELARLRDIAPELLPVVFQSLLQHIISLANNFPGDAKVLAMDECHILLNDPVIRQFIELGVRTFRKLKVSIVGISQGISEWKGDGSSKGILENISGVLACQLSPQAAEDMVSTFNLSPNERENLMNLQVMPGEFSEFMAMRYTPETRKSTVCANILSPIEYAMYTSAPDDVALINRWLSPPHSLTVTKAIERFSEKYPRGVVFSGGLASEDVARDAA